MHKIFENTNIDYSNYKKVVYKKNDIVFNERDLVKYIGLVETGLISIKTYTYNEKEYEINNISSNQIFGEFIIFSNNPCFLGTGIALKETIVIYITKDELFSLMKNKVFFENYLSLTSSVAITVQNKVKVLSQKEIRDKILFLLFDNLKRNKSTYLYINSKNQLASYLNITRPSLSRELIKMKEEGIITYSKHYIELKNGNSN